MADGDRLAPGEQVLRYARPSDVYGDILDGSAFVRPEKDRDGLSVTRLGIVADDFDRDIERLRQIIGARMTLKRNGRLAQISVGDIEAVGAIVGQALSVVEDHLPAENDKPANPAHALILGLPFDGAEQGSVRGMFASDLLAMRVSRDKLHLAVA